MAVFISHSFSDKDQFDNIADALKEAGIPYWDPGAMKPGATLSEQLHEAIKRSELCIFVATHSSVESAWCGAELGAFWGAGRRVIIYIADSSLKNDQLPRQFQGHFLERRISKIVEAAKDYLVEASAVDKGDDRDEGRVKIEGEYRTGGSNQYRIRIAHLSGAYYRIENPEWEGVGFFDGESYYGVYKVYENAIPEELRGNWGGHRARYRLEDREFDLIGIEMKEESIFDQFKDVWIGTNYKK
jgi:hypothetical protein